MMSTSSTHQARDILLAVGGWLRVNGEAIYGTGLWKIYGEGPTQVFGSAFEDTASKPFTGQDIRFTTKGDTLYAIALAWPENGELSIKSLADYPVTKVELLGTTDRLTWKRNAGGLRVHLPAARPNDYAFVFRIRQ